MDDIFYRAAFSMLRIIVRPSFIFTFAIIMTIIAGSIHFVYRPSIVTDFQIYLKPHFTFQHTLINLDTPEGKQFLARMPKEDLKYLAKKFDIVEYLINSGPTRKNQ